MRINWTQRNTPTPKSDVPLTHDYDFHVTQAELTLLTRGDIVGQRFMITEVNKVCAVTGCTNPVRYTALHDSSRMWCAPCAEISIEYAEAAPA